MLLLIYTNFLCFLVLIIFFIWLEVRARQNYLLTDTSKDSDYPAQVRIALNKVLFFIIIIFQRNVFIFFLIFPTKLNLWELTSSTYRIYPKYSDTSTPYHICTKIWTSTIHYPMLCLKIAGWVANSVDPDETSRSVASHLGLYCLLRPVCPNIYGKYGNTTKYVFMKK